MANKAITIEIKGDAKDFTVSINEADGALKRFEGTTDSAGSKLADFGKLAAAGFVAVGAAVVGAGVAAFKVGEEFSQAYDQIRVGTGQTGEALQGLESDFKAVVSTVPTSFENASTAIAQLNQRLGLTGAPLEKLSGQFLELSRITKTDLTSNIASLTRVFGDWSIADQSKAMDEMFRATQKTGVGIDKLAEQVVQFGAPLRGLGFGFEDALAMMSKWEAEGVNTTNVMGAMKKAYGEFAKDFGERAPEEFRKFITEIQKAPNAAAAAALAIEKLGVRNGPDFAAAVKEGRFAFGDLVDQIKNGSDTIEQAGIDTQHFGEKWTLFTNQLKVVFEPLATSAFDGISNAAGAMFDGFNGAATSEAGLLGWLGNVGTKARIAFDAIRLFAGAFTGAEVEVGAGLADSGAVPTITALGAACRTLANDMLPKLATAWDDAFGGVQAAMGWLADHKEVLEGVGIFIGIVLVDYLYAMATAAWAAAVPWIALNAPLIAAWAAFLGVAAAAAALGAGILWLYNNFGPFKTAVDAVGTAVMWLWEHALVPAGEWIMGTLVPILGTVAGAIGGFLSLLAGWAGNIPEALGGFVEFFELLPGRALEFLGQLWTTISTWIVTTATALPGQIAGLATAFLSWLVDAVVALPGQLAYMAGFLLGWIAGQVVNIALTIAGWTTAFFSWLVNVMIELPGRLASLASTVWNWLTTVAVELPLRLMEWSTTFRNWALNLAVSIGGWLLNTANSVANWLLGVAAALPGWLMQWLAKFAGWAAQLAGNMPGWLATAGSKLLEWVQAIPGMLTGALGKMLDVGKSIVEGLWNGISGAGGWLMGKIKDFVGGIIGGFMHALDSHSPSRKMMKVGGYIGQGLAIGIDNEQANVQSSLNGLIGGMRGGPMAVRGELMGGYRRVNLATAGGGGGVVVNVNVQGAVVATEEALGRVVNRGLQAADRAGHRMAWTTSGASR